MTIMAFENSVFQILMASVFLLDFLKTLYRFTTFLLQGNRAATEICCLFALEIKYRDNN